MNPESDQNDPHDLEEQHPSLASAQRAGAAAPAAATQPDAGLAEHDVRARASEPQLVAGSTQTPVAATRFVETSVGRLSYTELAERLAPALQAIDLRIRSGEFADRPLDEVLLLLLHAQLSGELFPADAGRYRSNEVRVGNLEPPVPACVPQQMREYVLNLNERLQHLAAGPDDLLLEFLAYAEGMLLSIHPFPDLNGRVSRLWLTEILQRLKLPPVDVVPIGIAFRERYLAALAAGDRRDWKPLMTLWKERLSQVQGVNEVVLHGCTPTPLASYLKALAVLRLVAEASAEDGGDPEATGFWRNDVFVLRTRLTEEQLLRFFLECYRPTPLMAPWNGGSGFYFQEGKLAEKDPVTGKKLKTGVRNQATEATRTVAAIAQSDTPRFGEYRSAIEVAKRIIGDFGLVEAPDGSVSSDQKDRFIQTFRNLASDSGLQAMDCCVVIASDKITFPPLLGTGGNDGNLDFTNNFMQRLLDVIDVSTGRPTLRSANGLDASLFNVPDWTLADKAIGQFDPGSAGGPNGSSGFDSSAAVNSWDFVLMLEGAMLFAASAVRRLESGDQSVLSAPFVVYSRVGTSGASSAEDDNDSRNEVWMPIWPVPCSLAEVQNLVTEGRATVGARMARDGLDFARSVAQLGISRGVAGFQRYAFLKRQGKNFLAVPLSRIRVRRHQEADLISELEYRNWLGSVQRYARDENSPNAFRSASRQLDAALFALTQQPGRTTFQAVLRQIGRIEGALSVSIKSQEAIRMPVPRLGLSWATKAQDISSPEFAIAAALAGLRMRNASGYFVLHARRHLVAVSETMSKNGDRNWEPTSRAVTWGKGPLTNNVAALLHRRRLEAELVGTAGELLASATGATCADVLAFIDGETDDIRINELFSGLACVDLTGFPAPEGRTAAVLPLAFALLKVLFTPESTLRALKWLAPDRTLRLPAEIPARLASDNVEVAVRIAWQRLRALGVKLPGRDPPHIVATDGPRWLAALCIPLTFAETGRLLRGLDLAPEATSEPLPGFLA